MSLSKAAERNLKGKLGVVPAVTNRNVKAL